MIGNIDILAKELCKLPKKVRWNLNYNGSDNITTSDRESQEMKFIKEPVEFTKEFVKASRQIYKLIFMNPKVSTGNLPVICR